MYEAVVIGASAGGLNALSKILPALPDNYSLPVIIVLHRVRESDDFLSRYLDKLSSLQVNEARLRESIKPASVYIAPAGYHLLVERDKTFSLSIDPPVNYAIPSIDVLFESAAVAYKDKLIGVILTGANADGSSGLAAIKEYGGLTIAQDPLTAESTFMPAAAIERGVVDNIIGLEKIGLFLKEISDG